MGMGELATRNLTDKQSRFIRFMAESGDSTGAVMRAGYEAANPAQIAWELLRVPHILAALQNEVRKKLVSGAPMALKIITDIATNSDVNPKTRLDAAKTLLDRAGHIAPRAAAEKPTDQPLHEMTTDQLRELAGRLEDEIAGRAKPVASAQAEPADSQAVDMIG